MACTKIDNSKKYHNSLISPLTIYCQREEFLRILLCSEKHIREIKSYCHVYVRSHLVAESHAVVSTECSHLPLGHCLVPGRPIPHWGITLSPVIATRRSFLRVRLLVGCGGLMDARGPTQNFSVHDLKT